MERIVERPGALDIHQASVTACVRVWEGRELEEHMAEFPTTVHGLLALRDWLEALAVKQVAMEATGVYWKPVWAVLEDSFELMLVNATSRQAGPGTQDGYQGRAVALPAAGGGAVARAVSCRRSRSARSATSRGIARRRSTSASARPRGCTRSSRTPGSSSACVATDIIGKSGRDMLDALVAGTTDPAVLADLARGQLRKKIPALREALVGRFDAEHALIVGQILAHIDFLDEAIERLSDEIEQQIAPFAAQRDLLMTIPGVKQRTAEVLIAEIGVDMSVFPTPKHLASWAEASAPATTSPPANAAPAKPAKATNGSEQP